MKENIPFDKFIDWVKYNNNPIQYSLIEHQNIMFEMYSIMITITWDDFLSCSEQEMEKIPIGWIYDWTHVTCSWDKQDKVKDLYSRYNIVPLSGRVYLYRFDPTFGK